MSTRSPEDDNPRPQKRQKLEPESCTSLNRLPPAILLLSLHTLLAHPPTHRHHTRSLFLTLFALRKCLSFPGLDSSVECRAWTELAEVGFRIGLDEPGIESEVEKAVRRALIIAHKHPSLRIHTPHLTRLSARLASHQNNPKFAQNTLKKLLTNFLIPSDPPHITYAAHLAYITSLSSSNLSEASDTDTGRYSPSNANPRALTATRALHELATRNKHKDVALLAMVLELRELVQNGVWNRVGKALESIEKGMDIASELEPAPAKTAKTLTATLAPPKSPTVIGKNNLEKVLIVHILILGVVYYTYMGDSANSQSRMKKLHDMLDGGALDAFGPSGIVEVSFPDQGKDSPPLLVQVTHPRVVFSLGFLVSSVAKRDPVGRKPKRMLFASEGVLVVDREMKREVAFPIWASVADVQEYQVRMHKLKADMVCELIGVAISRSEFDDAERNLAQLIAHTRTHGLFSAYSARITLHQAHFAHALGRTERALKCYQIAAFLSRRRTHTASKDNTYPTSDKSDDEGSEDYWLNVSARAGELWLRIGLAAQIPDKREQERETQMEALRTAGAEVVKECEGLGGTLKAVGEVLTACLSKEFLVAKTHLRTALGLSTTSQDNHMRALVLALVAAQYVHTSMEHAETMLATSEQLAAGLGAQPKAAAALKVVEGKKGPEAKAKATGSTGAAAGGDGVGNAHLRLWIGERMLELKRRAGNEKSAAKQVEVNERLGRAVMRVGKFGMVG